MSILAFAASHRPASLNRQLLNCAIACLPEAAVKLCHYGELDMPLYNDHVRETEAMPHSVEHVHELFDAADSFIIASPEYNWSYPANLKNIIDWLSCYSPNPFKNKPVLLLCATPSEQGGTLGMQALKATLGGWLGMHVFPMSFVLNNATDALNGTHITNAAKQQQIMSYMQDFSCYRSKFIS